jgi:PAS domain S-box-containing protein
MRHPFEQFFDAMPCYLTVQDRDFKIVRANDRFRRDFGEVHGRYCYQVYKRRSEKCDDCPVEKALWDGQCHRSEERVKCLDGREVSVLVEATPLKDDNGQTTFVMEMSTDITHIRRMQEQLQQTRDRYQLLFEEVPCYISIQDEDLKIARANRAFQEDFGNALGCKCYQAYKHRKEECFPCPVREAFEDGMAHTREEVVTNLKGEQLNVLVTAAPLRDADGRITRVMEMSANITQVRELESQLSSLGLLIGSVSHGLKGLLNGLSGGMYLVDSGFKKGNQQRVEKGWATVKRNVDRIKSMVSDILYYAKERKPNWEPVDAAHLATEVMGLTTPRAVEHDVKMDSACAEDVGEFDADAQALRSMLVNLLENSVDACRLDSKQVEHRVSLKVEGNSDHVRFVIEDNGMGMDRETREKAFSLFFSSKGAGGTGLGLFISNRIAEAHGGSIKVSSQEGVGSSFAVTLPRKRPPAEAAAPASMNKEALRG